MSALVLAAAGARLLESLLYGVEPIDPAVLLIGTQVLLAAAALAAFVPAWLSSRIPAVRALRSE